MIAFLKSQANTHNVEGMARFGIRPAHPLGISMAVLRPLARKLGRSHAMSVQLWESGWHEARILAALVEEPACIASREMDVRARGFDSWDVCDQWCLNVFWRTPYAWRKARLWSRRGAEFGKRAAFSLVAVLAVHDQAAEDSQFTESLSWIEREAGDDRHYVAKAVNWALRQIGKRNARLRRAATATAKRIAEQQSRTARWIAADALRELRSR